MTLSFMRALIDLIRPEDNTYTIKSVARLEELALIIGDHFEQISGFDEQMELLLDLRNAIEKQKEEAA